MRSWARIVRLGLLGGACLTVACVEDSATPSTHHHDANTAHDGLHEDGARGDAGNPNDAAPTDATILLDSSNVTDAPTNSEPLALMGITAAHNTVRAGVGVAGLVWNNDLAATAQAWIDTCTDVAAPLGLIDHNPNRSVGHPWYVGENQAGSAVAINAEQAVQLWASEVQHYDYSSNSCSEGKECGHYTQLVWANSTQLGCAIGVCPGLTFGNTIVCDYGPGGNDGSKPY